MRIAFSESFNKWLEYYIKLAQQARIIPRKLRLVFDQYDENEDYPRMKVTTQDLDILDQIWRSQCSVVLSLWVKDERAQDLKQISNFLHQLIQAYGQNIPVFDHTTVLYDETDIDDVKDKELGEKVTAITGGQSQLTFPTILNEKTPTISPPFAPIVEGSLVVYQYDSATDTQEAELALDTDYTIDYTTGTITWLIVPDLADLTLNDKELRCYYTYRDFHCISKILEGSLLETPFNSPDRDNPGVIRTDFAFDILY
jgi:hypothetical protein